MNLSLNFWYFLASFMRIFAQFFWLIQKEIELKFCIFYPLFSQLIFYAAKPSFFIVLFLKNSFTEVSDLGLDALGSSLKDLKSLTNLSLNFEYFFNYYFSPYQTHLRTVFLAAPEMLCIWVVHVLSTPLLTHILGSGASFFDREFFLNRCTQVSNQGEIDLSYTLNFVLNSSFFI